MFYFRKTCAIFEKCSILEKRVRSLWCFVTERFWHCLLIKKKWTGLDSFKTTAQTSGREFRRTRITIPKEVIKYRIRAAFTLMFYTEKAELWKLLFFLFGFFFTRREIHDFSFLFFSLYSPDLWLSNTCIIMIESRILLSAWLGDPMKSKTEMNPSAWTRR